MYKNRIKRQLIKLAGLDNVLGRIAVGTAGAGIGATISGAGTLNRGNMHGETYGADPFFGIDWDSDPDTAKGTTHIFNAGSGILGAAAGDYVAKKLKLSTPWRLGAAAVGGVGNAALQAYLQDRAAQNSDSVYKFIAPGAANAIVGAIAAQNLYDAGKESDKLYREQLNGEQQY